MGIFIFSQLLLGCSTIKPYEKQHLLHPLMDDGKVARLSSDFANSTAGAQQRKLNGGGSVSSSSCPTCGG